MDTAGGDVALILAVHTEQIRQLLHLKPEAGEGRFQSEQSLKYRAGLPSRLSLASMWSRKLLRVES